LAIIFDWQHSNCISRHRQRIVKRHASREAGEAVDFSPWFSSRSAHGIFSSIRIYLRPAVVYSPVMKLISWNVNGLRAVLKKNFLEFIDSERPDILCLQETKCTPDQVEQLWPRHYTTYWNSAQKKGYSGTAIFTKERPLKVEPHIGVSEHDNEGRVLTAEFKEYFLVNVYVPNSKRELERLPYRQQWDVDFLKFLKKLEKKKPVIFCGDLNVAHTEIDLANPKANVRNHGFTIEERDGFTTFVNAGFVDTFREFEKSGGHYSWWSPMSGARARNVGWRIDYFLISQSLRPRLKKAFILPKILGSDHCPVGIEIK
jgi:exodeoxyribonuclease III